MKLISILGIERADFAYYVSLVLKSMQSTVLVIDNSISGDMYSALTKHEKYDHKENVITYRNVCYVRGVAYQKEAFDKFDYVLCFNGEAACDETVFRSDYIYIMPDYHIASLDKMREAVAALKTERENDELARTYVIMRDLINEKITDLAIVNRLDISEENIVGHISLEFEDLAKQLSFEYNGIQPIKGLSGDYVNALVYVIMQITGKKEKETKKLIKGL